MRTVSGTLKRISQNILLLGISAVLAVLGAEAISRAILAPVDFLNPTLRPDEFLNHRIEGYTGGHDEWGFRNPQKPETADIVCIGDSLTYGVSALASESWPAVLGKLRAERVYNMGLGGYGPIQYLHLMRTLSVRLNPKIVIVGFYFGNDLLDVYNLAQFNSRWSQYAAPGDIKTQSPAFVFARRPGKFLFGLRDWFSKNSVLYAIVSHLKIFEFVRVVEQTQTMGNENLIPFRDEKHNVIFNLDRQSRFLDLRDARIRTAMEITQRVFTDMRSVSENGSIRLIVVLLPTKERVYKQIVMRAGYIEKYPHFAEAIDQEDQARDQVAQYLKELRIETLDMLPSLESKVATKDLFPRTDPHPNNEGYRVIAETINSYLGVDGDGSQRAH